MIYLDASVIVKWFKKGERYEQEALNLLEHIVAFEVDGASSEWTGLEVVRGLKSAQNRGELDIQNDEINEVFQELEDMFATSVLQKVPVSLAIVRAKDCEIELSLSAADAIHLASAIEISAKYLVTDDEQHILKESAKNFASLWNLNIVNLPDLCNILGISLE